ncbi:MAG: alpha/beta hydrolase [Spirochaetes bacterium]|nr:MAG: alpha/beta hydrolase [Spirochaetota bacterium]
MRAKIILLVILGCILVTAAVLITALMFEGEPTYDCTKSHDGEWVVLLHGIMRGPASMEKLENALLACGYRVLNFGYPSTKESIMDSADLLGREMAKLPQGATIHFVTHSMGAIVVRYYLAHYRAITPARFVMIAPPNRGSSFAGRLMQLPGFRWLFGRAGGEVAQAPRSLVSTLPAPRCEFGVIAGGLGNSTGLNPLIDGDDDGTISVEETRLEGMKDFIQVKGQHSLLLLNRRVIDNVLAFLETGGFLH